jgi:hypothetical protein
MNLHEPKECLEERRFAGTVGSDDADQFALMAVQVGTVEDIDARQVAADQAVGTQQRAFGSSEMGFVGAGVSHFRAPLGVRRRLAPR